MTRRVLLAQSLLPVFAWADAADDVWEVAAAMAAALSDDNASGFLKLIDKEMPGYQDLESKVTALLDKADVQSNISPLGNEGSPAGRTLQLDWILRMKPKHAVSPLDDVPDGHPGDLRAEQREEAVTLLFHRDGKHWRVRKLDPIAFFAPPSFA